MKQKLLLLAVGFVTALSYCQETEPFMTIFTPPGDVSLQMNAAAILIDEILSEETQRIIDQMFDVAQGERGDLQKRISVGLAAPQIGIGKRIILVDIGVDSTRKELGTLKAYINPEITWYSDKIVEGREGCYSVDCRVIGMVPRSEVIQVKAFDRNGTVIAAEFSGFTARIFQHEVDHLNGIRFPDRIGPEGRLHWVEENEYSEYREKCETWSRKCPWNVWLNMKSNQPYSAPEKSS